MKAPPKLRFVLAAAGLVGASALEAGPAGTAEGKGMPGPGATPGVFAVHRPSPGDLQGPMQGVDSGTMATSRPRHEFYFTRAIYSSYGRRGWGRGGRGSWAVDYPEADRHFAEVIERVVGLDVYDYENAVSLADPELRRYPILYALEVGRMALTEEEIRGLRDYLDAGGFLIIDDFWGSREWGVFEHNIRKVLPGRQIVELEDDHPIFRIFYEIDEVLQVPNVRQGYYGGPTWEKDGYDPYVLGIFDERGRLMVVINWNTDLGDAWEWSDDPFYPMKYSTFAYEMGANFIVYGMSH